MDTADNFYAYHQVEGAELPKFTVTATSGFVDGTVSTGIPSMSVYQKESIEGVAVWLNTKGAIITSPCSEVTEYTPTGVNVKYVIDGGAEIPEKRVIKFVEND